MKKTTLWTMEMMLVSTRMSLFFVAVLLFTGLTACEPSDDAMEAVTQSEEQIAVSEEKQSDGKQGEIKEKDEKDDNGEHD